MTIRDWLRDRLRRLRHRHVWAVVVERDRLRLVCDCGAATDGWPVPGDPALRARLRDDGSRDGVSLEGSSAWHRTTRPAP